MKSGRQRNVIGQGLVDFPLLQTDVQADHGSRQILQHGIAIHMFFLGLDFVEFGKVEKDGKNDAKSPVIIEICTGDPGIVTEIAQVVQADESFKAKCTGQEIGGHHGHM